MADVDEIYLAKAEESLAGAESELVNGRFNNCANRCYYACLQAAVYALALAGIRPGGASGQWGHDFVQARFVGDLVNRRKVYGAELRQTLARNLELRRSGDYRPYQVSQTQVSRALRRTREFVEEIRLKGGV